MDFSEALVHIKDGKKVLRSGWNGKNLFLFLINKSIVGYSGNYSLQSFIVIQDPKNNLYPWKPSQQDLLTDDWEVTKD